MSALDQAFINAYKQQGPARQTAPAEAASPSSSSDACEGKESLTATAARLDDVMAVLEQSSGKMAEGRATESDAHDEGRHGPENEGEGPRAVLPISGRGVRAKTSQKGSQKRKKKTPPAPTIGELDVPDAVYRLDPPCPTIPGAPRAAAFTSPQPPAREKTAAQGGAGLPSGDASELEPEGQSTSDLATEAWPGDTQTTRRVDAPSAGGAQNQARGLPDGGFHGQTGFRVFQPMLQVEHFAWPKVCFRLESAAAGELDRLADTLLAAAKQGMKVIGLSGGVRGEGATTLLLCAARRMIKRGVKTAAVDGDLVEPQLAKRLGLLPQLGWEDVGTGRQPVEEVLVESVADNLAVMPLCTPLAIEGMSYASQRLMAESLNTLRKNYDLVLLDLGPLENPRSLGDLCGGGLNCRVDAVMLVHRAGKVPATCMPQARQALATSGAAVIGIIENFVQSGAG
jgi:Mrp family chromosome partitioning ATPase